MGKYQQIWRTFPHANSGRKIAERYDEDREEALEYTDSFSTNRKGGEHNYPNLYDDEYVEQYKYPVKPKRHHDNRDTIRKPDT